VVLHAGTAAAASGGPQTLPHLAPGEVNKAALTLTVDTAWVDSPGYRPVRIVAKSTIGPVPADRGLSVTFRPMEGYTANESVAVTQTIEIPAGGTTAEMTMAVPQLCQWGRMGLDVYEDGEHLKQLSISEGGSWISFSNTNKGDGASPVTLILSD